MSEKALVQFYDITSENGNFTRAPEVSPAVYLHWLGPGVPQFLMELRKLMAGRIDVSYTCARFIGICHSHTPHSGTGIGVLSRSTLLQPEDSHGGHGIFVVNCRTWQVERFGLALAPSPEYRELCRVGSVWGQDGGS